MSLTLRGIKESALTHGELDNNFLWLKGRDIVDATLAGTNLVLTKDDTTTFNIDLSSITGNTGGNNGGNMWHVPYGYTLTVEDNFQSFIYGDLYIEGTVDLQTNAQLVVLNGDIIISGGSIVGSGTTQVVELPDFDTKISGLTYTADTLTIYQNDGTDFSVSIKQPAYKVYTALLTQTGTDAPVATVLENTLSAAIVWTYGGFPGYYVGTLTGAFDQAKTFLMIQKDGTLASSAVSRRDNTINWQDINSIYVQTTDESTGLNNVLNYTTIEIRVYL